MMVSMAREGSADLFLWGVCGLLNLRDFFVTDKGDFSFDLEVIC